MTTTGKIVLLVLLLLPLAVAESNNDNTILPTSSLWKIDLFFENVVIFFTPSDIERGKLYLLSAQERTNELKELGMEVTSDIFNMVEIEWTKNILNSESLGTDVSIEQNNHLKILKEIKDKVPSSVSDIIGGQLLPVVDLT